MKKMRLSYSLLAAWERGDIQGVVDMYFHVDRPANEAMINGRNKHKEVEEYIKDHNSFPEWFFKYGLTLPEGEKVVVAEYNDMFDLKCIFDCYDPVDKTLFEYKFSTADSLEWARTWQLPIYFLIADIAQIEIEKAILIRNDGKKSDFCVVHNSKRLRDKASNVIDSLGPDIHTYFTREGLI